MLSPRPLVLPCASLLVLASGCKDWDDLPPYGKVADAARLDDRATFQQMQSNCDKMSPGTARDNCYTDLNKTRKEMKDSTDRMLDDYRRCKGDDILKQLDLLKKAVDLFTSKHGGASFDEMLAESNVMRVLDGVEISAAGTSVRASDRLTCTLTSGSIRVRGRPGATPMGPWQLSGSFTIATSSSSGSGPVTSFGLRASQGSDSWQIAMLPWPSNRYYGYSSSGYLRVKAVAANGGLRIPFVVALRVKLTGRWSYSTGGWTAATSVFPRYRNPYGVRYVLRCRGKVDRPRIAQLSAARIGDPLALRITHRPSLSQGGVVMIGTYATLSLSLFGAPGCYMLVNPAIMIPLAPGSATSRDVTVHVPNSPRLVGAGLWHHAAVIERSANALGLVPADAIWTRIAGR